MNKFIASLVGAFLMEMVMKIFCCTCDEVIIAKALKGMDVYPHREDLYDLNFFECPSCNNFVGTHKNSGKPLGTIASKELKQARIAIHRLLDPIWKNGTLTRTEVYRRLSEHLGIDFHTADVTSIKMAHTVLSKIHLIKTELL